MIKLDHLKNQKDYNELIKFLKPFGKFQIRLYIITFIYIYLNAILKTIFALTYSEPNMTKFIDASQCIGLFLTSYLALRYGRKLILFFGTLMMFAGSLLLIFSENHQYPRIFGLICFNFVHYTSITILMSIICQYMPAIYMGPLFVGQMLMFTLGKLTLVFIYQAFEEQNKDIGLVFLLPITAIQFILNFGVSQSPRCYLDTNIIKAEILIQQISRINGCNEELLKNRMGSSFVWKRINLKKYNWWTLFSYPSLNFHTYSYVVMFFCLGLLSRCPSFVLQFQTEFDPQFNRIIEVKWVAGFQLIGILPLFVAVWACKRRLTIIVITFVSCFIVFWLFLLHVDFIFSSIPLLFDMAFLGLNATVSMTLYSFITLSSLQFFPHTIRVIGLGVLMSSYYFGQFIETILSEFLRNSNSTMEMFLEAAILLTLHSFGVKETFGERFNYEIKQIQEEQNDDY